MSIDHANAGLAETANLGKEAGGGAILAGKTTMADTLVRETLVRVLGEGVDVHRCLAAQALGRGGDGQAVEPLIAALVDEDEDVRSDAAEALVLLGDERAVKPLLENLLGDPCSEVKLAALDIIALFRPREALPVLRSLVGERTTDIVWDEEEIYHSEWDSWADLQPKAIAALAAYGDLQAVPLIVAALEDEDGQDLRGVAFAALAALGEEGIEALAGFVDSPDERTRVRAAGRIASLTGPISERAIARAFEDDSPEVVLAAAAALAGRDPRDPRLTPLLDDPRPGIRAEMVRLCGGAHAERIESWLADETAAVRTAALKLIADQPKSIDRAAAIDWVRANLEGTPLGVVSAAGEALAALSPKAAREALAQIVGAPERTVEARVMALRVLSRIATNASVPALKALLVASHRPIRIEAMAALAKIAGRSRAKINRAERVLIAALGGKLTEPEDDEPDNLITAGEPGDAKPGAVPPMADGAMEDDERPAPTSTLDAIMAGDANQGEPAAKADIVLDEEDAEFLRLAASGSGKRRIAPQAAVVLDDDVPRSAARLLGDVPHEDALAALAVALGSSDREVRGAAADSLARIAEQRGSLPDTAVDANLQALPGADREHRPSIVRALGHARPAKASAGNVVMALIGLLDDEDYLVRIEAVGALAKLDEVGPGISRLLDDPEPGVRLAVAATLARIGGAEWLDRLVEMAFENEGHHRRDIPRLLRDIDRQRANQAFIEVLGDGARRREWTVAIEALDEMNAYNGGDSEMAGV
ncbi:MAG: HEAT repeat domain-containing protein [Alphaproteobacteria bacterium]